MFFVPHAVKGECCAGTAEERGMTATRGRQTQSESDDQASSETDEVYDVPVPVRCRLALKPLCRYVPFMPCYDSQHITGQLRRIFNGVCRRRQSNSDYV